MDFQEVIENNLRDHVLVSSYDEDSFKGVELCLGIDEAGRGPVLGPMVYAALFCPVDKEKQLKEMECADSKTLKEEDRERIFKTLNDENKLCGFALKVLSPHTISTGMLRRVKYNLNEISHDAAIALIHKLYTERKLNIVQVFLDTVGDPTKYEMKLSKIFPKLKIKVSKKADSLYPCVSAASICAKVTRDTVLKNWKFVEDFEGQDWGSGYPGDPLTKKFLDASISKVFGFVKLIRFGWSTAAVKLNKNCVQIKWEDNDGEDNEYVDDEDNDDTEENEKEEKPKKEAKKPAPKQKSKLSVAVANDKNNSSILNFFQKSQKRTISDTNNACVDVVSHFLLNRKLKLCVNF